MGLFDRFTKKSEPKPAVTAEQPKPKKSPKDIATEKGEPWVGILSVDIDPKNIGAGSFELDWNDKFLAQLVRAGYQLQANEPENVIVDRWFQDVCRNVVLETFEQFEANNPRIMNRKDIGNGRSEIG